MDLRSRFVRQLARIERESGRLSSPSQMCRSVRDLLGVAGAGLVMSQRLVRRPVGADGPSARVAEELQASLGVGPCLAAEARQTILVADEADLRSAWPVYHAELVSRTPFRATLSFPIVRDRVSVAALNVYSNESSWALDDELDTIQSEVVDLVGLMLLLDVRTDDMFVEVSEQYLARSRSLVFTAVGMLQEAAEVDDTSAIALLRGYAFASGRLLDDASHDLVHHRLSTTEVLHLNT